MAFNLRPKTKTEIQSKKKAFGEQASLIFEFVKKNYGEAIILDPQTNFNKIKIPRIVQEKVNITELKRKIEKSGISLKGMELSFGNGSGKAGGGMDAVETAKQENATRLYCESFIEKQKFPTPAQLKKVYENADDEWIHTFERQAKAMKTYLKTIGYNWSRDDGIMPFVENVALKKCGVRTKDSWNPADIYCVRKTKESKIKKDIAAIGEMKIEPGARLDLLNDYMRQAFIKQDLIGVSLKKLGKKSISLEETNVVKKKPLSDISIVKDSISIDLDLIPNKGEFITGELSFKLNVKGSIVNVQVRAFSGGSRESTQMDMTGSGEAAKLGKVSSQQAIDPFLDAHNLKRRMGTDVPRVGEWTNADIKKYVDEQKSMQSMTIGGSRIYFGKNDWKKTLLEAIELEKNNNRTASQLSAKIQCFQWIMILKEVEKKKKLKDFLTVLYYGAKKQYDSAGPFLKIS
jgi:hypothetical protein